LSPSLLEEADILQLQRRLPQQLEPMKEISNSKSIRILESIHLYVIKNNEKLFYRVLLS
jgi:hypothetical protein